METPDNILEMIKEGDFMNELKKNNEGFFFLEKKGEEPILVHAYNCRDAHGQYGFGFNIHDGGGFLPVTDLTPDTKVTPAIVEPMRSTVFEICDDDLCSILQSLLREFELMRIENERGETKESFEDRKCSARSLIAILSEVVGESRHVEEGESIILKVGCSGTKNH